MLQQPKADDYVVSSGEEHSVKEFVELAFDYLSLDWRKYVIQDPTLFRPAEVDRLLGDSSKARRVLGWKPEVNFPTLVRMMVESDLELLKKQKGKI